MSIRDVKQIKIMIESNVSKKPKALELSDIHNPNASESGDNSGDKSNNEKDKKNADNAGGDYAVADNNADNNADADKNPKYPYFIGSIAYPEEFLKTISYNKILKIFFDKNTFFNTIVENKTLLSDEKAIEKNIEKNIMIMLNLIFPTSYPSTNNINTSYNKYLMKTQYELKFDLGELKIPGFTNNSIAEYSYLNHAGSIYTVTEITWLNDVFNEPNYKKFIEKLIVYNNWVDGVIIDNNSEKEELIKTFSKGLESTTTATTTTTGEKPVKSLRINDNEIYLIKRQKKLFSEDDLINEINNIWNYFVVSKTETNNLWEKIKDNIIKSKVESLQPFRKNVMQEGKPKTNIVFDEANFLFKNTTKLEEKDMETKINDINNNNDDDKMPIRFDAVSFNILLHFLYKSYYKYRKAKAIEESDNARLYNENVKYDTNIDDLIKNIKKLNGIDFTKVTELDLSPDKQLYKDITESMNIIENIKNLFGQIQFYKSNELTILTNKINQLVELSTEIHKYILVDQYVLQKKNGICVNYGKLIESKEDAKILSEVLKQSKYAPFNAIVETIDKFYNNRKCMNSYMQKLMDDYFNCTNSKFDDEVISKIEKMENNEKLDKSDFDKWNVSVTMYSDKKNTSNKHYEIFVYMELIHDKLTSANASNVSCSFLDEKLTDMLKQLTSSQDNEYNVPRSNKVFDVSDITKKKPPAENSSETPVDKPASKNPQPSETKMGGKHQETRKNKRNKKMRKTRRYRIRV